MPRRVAFGVLLLILASSGCSDDGGASSTSTSGAPPETSQTATPTTVTPTTTVAVPSSTTMAVEVGPFDVLAELVGTTDARPDHWVLSDSPVERFQVRLFGPEFATIPEFPVTMNGCALRQLRVEWRSLSEPVRAGYTSFLDPGMAVDIYEEAAPTDRGDLVLNGCEQPAFASPTDGTIVNLVVEVAEFDPAVGN